MASAFGSPRYDYKSQGDDDHHHDPDYDEVSEAEVSHIHDYHILRNIRLYPVPVWIIAVGTH